MSLKSRPENRGFVDALASEIPEIAVSFNQNNDVLDMFSVESIMKKRTMKKRSVNEDFAGQSVSHGTLRYVDLLQAFFDVLDASEMADVVSEETKALIDGLGADEVEDDQMEEAGYALEELYDLLSEHAPEGSFFGAHEGDGSDFGFWQDEDSEDDEASEPSVEEEEPEAKESKKVDVDLDDARVLAMTRRLRQQVKANQKREAAEEEAEAEDDEPVEDVQLDDDADFVITIATSNEAFSQDKGFALAEILRKIADKLTSGDLEGKILDANGNRVGEFGEQ